MDGKDVYLLDLLRTPFGIVNGVFKHLRAEELAAAVIRGLAAENTGILEETDHVIIANAVGGGGNMARLSWLTAGGSLGVPCTTLDYQCGGGIQSVIFGQMLIQAGQADLVLVGGTESVSTEPVRLLKPHDPDMTRYADGIQTRGRFSPDILGDSDMAVAAEYCAKREGFGREALDAVAIRSHQRANASETIERLKPYIRPVGNVSCDEGLGRRKVETLIRRMKPLYADGILTAGNTCLMNDGAAAGILCSRKYLEKTGRKPLARVIASASAARHPLESSLGHIGAIERCLERAGLELEELDQIEVNEAFASKILSLVKHFNLDDQVFDEKVNPLGGALVYGHPYSASGTNLLIQLVAALETGQRGIAAMGVAGGQGNALILEKGEGKRVVVG